MHPLMGLTTLLTHLLDDSLMA
ncbi:hypothetical protein Ahy_B09g097158 isoform B [Arachis hypogaea]|uniref:Uncharacterized protein n=1 Tax=Arachis hypogaea TaxID=3818 RepID=A0A444XNL7_ARAHY|nr:hypothetical protein Ahy_B09g097158 isoform B [Arachis hypogaea]